MTHATDIFVGIKLREARLALKLTQNEVSQHLGMKSQQVQKYETAYNRTSASKLFEMAELYQTPVQNFFPEIRRPPTIVATRELVFDKFEGQFDSQGVPMALHMQRVASGVIQDVETIITAWLHDIVEDTKVTLQDLTNLGYSAAVTEAVYLLTHVKKELTYPEYIQRLCDSENKIALRVKISDQTDNNDPKRWVGMNPHMKRALGRKWFGVQLKLEKVLEALP